MALSLKQQHFVEAYLAEPNGAKAAIAAGYKPSGARSTASKLLQSPDVAAAIDAARQASERRAAEHADRAVVTRERIVEELAKLAFHNIRRVATWGPGGLVVHPAEDIDPDTAAAIADITESRQGRETRVSVKMHSKLTAITLLMRHLGMLDRRDPEPTEVDQGGIDDDADPEIRPESEAPANRAD